MLYDLGRSTEIALPLQVPAPERLKGTCVVHEQFTPEDIAYFKRAEGVDLVLAHPEVRPDVAVLADHVGGTWKMIQTVGASNARKILYLTECDLAAPLIEAYPEREFVTPCKLCPYMKKNTLDNVLYALQEEKWEVTVDPTISGRARRSIETMFELTQ